MAVALTASAPSGFSVPSTKPNRSRLSKNRKPWTSSTTVTAPAIDLRMRPANSKQTSSVSARIWKSRSPGVAGAVCRGPFSSMNGCSSAGRGPPNNRSQASEPIEAKADRAHQPRQIGQRVVHGRFAAFVDGDNEEDRRRRQRREDGLRLDRRHSADLSVVTPNFRERRNRREQGAA